MNKKHAENLWRPDKKFLAAYCLGWAPIGLSYFLILFLFLQVSGFTLVTTWTSNVLIPFIMGVGVAWIIIQVVTPLSVRWQLILNTVGAIMFSTVWALALFRMLQLFRGLFQGDWSFQGFNDAALAWQLFQGLAIYFVIASGSYAYWAINRLQSNVPNSPPQGHPAQMFIKTDNGLIPLALVDIIAFQSQDNQVIIYGRHGQQVTRKTLQELEEKFCSMNFARAHRSWLINLAHVQAMEPAGNGRLSIHLSKGISFETSRAGAKALKTAISID